ncbi:TetR/AcrR family transcriptional regulator [Marinomonas rhizomae]|uniref:TetR family transcriptional regulator n=1 Tax=Marinomonas rhizomae TaxID=491948 RepID=A0A366JA10_9GAMM|nr:TetR/AcrR family transcriptional regulator [Marinomonas rhizomae]RBP83783.1 TetR family transcriptional regulator [Marinomonas rhizomae]RNF73505.1 TetR/AcrR family transcriptional regulator [Marinomonas rhizomae]
MIEQPKKEKRSGRPSKNRTEETSKKIIRTAASLFATQGYAATSIEQVASACSAGKDTIYRRYSSKLELFQAVVEDMRCRIVDRLTLEIETISNEGNKLEHLKHIARWFLTVNLDPEMIAFKRIALSESKFFDVSKSAQQHSDPIMDRLILLVKETQKSNFLRQGDPEKLAMHLLHSIVFGPSNDAMLGKTTYSSVEAQNNYFEQAWMFFLFGANTEKQS